MSILKNYSLADRLEELIFRTPSPGTRLYGMNSYSRPNSAKRNVRPPQLVTRTFDVSSYDLSQMGKSGEMYRAMRQMGIFIC
ncbi:MAG: hypothetical protein EZS28_037567 [Streblomastix strix]|uniref:Uncharacterized protein n=1 Tax=Streblomastix strix TaxID=222440 RepID=A0A5J4U7P5_9EUKA|nr:MAG: hypothetical protein EZS28_037567 [Streblomastix strix]